MKKINKILIKSYIKRKDVYIYMLIISIVIMLIINVLNTALYSIGEKQKNNAEKNYGTYKYAIIDKDYDTVLNIKNDKKVYEAAICQETMSDEEFIISCEKNYLKLLGIKILDGKFPDNEDEVMCNIDYLYGLGYSYDEMIGARIKVNNEELKVTGLVDYEVLREIEYSGRFLIYNLQYKQFAKSYDIVINFPKNDFSINKKEVLKKYKISEEDCNNNGNYLYMANRDEEGKPTYLLKSGYILLIFIVGCLIILSCSVINMIIERIKKINNIYFMVGVEKQHIFKSLIYILMLFYSVGIVINLLFDVIYMNINKYPIWYFISSSKILLLYLLVLIALNIYIIRRKIYTDKAHKNIRKKVFDKKNSLSANVNLYKQLSKSISVFGKFKMVSMILPLVVSGLLFIASFYYISLNKDYFKNLNDYDYEITFVGKIYDKSEIDDFNKVIDNLEEKADKDDTMEILPIYYDNRQNISVPKSKLNPKFINFLGNKSIGYRSQQISDSDYFNFNIMIIAVDEKYCEKLGLDKDSFKELNDNECILVNKVNMSGIGEVKSGLKKEDVLNLKIEKLEYEQPVEIKISDTIDNINIDLDDDDLVKVIVTKTWYMQNFSDSIIYPYPEIVFAKINSNDNNTINFLRGYKNIYVFDINKNNQIIKEQNRIIYSVSLFIILLVLLITLMNIILIVTNRMYDIKVVSNILKIIGVSDKKNIKVFIFDIRKILLSSYGLVLFISTIVCYYMFIIDVSFVEFIKYYYPYKYLLALGVIYFILYQFLILIFKNKIVNGEIMRELKEENE